MDRFVSLFGYLQNYVVTGRRSGRVERGSDSPRRTEEENKVVFLQDESGFKTEVIKKHLQCTGSVKSTNVAGEESFLGDSKDGEHIIGRNKEFLSDNVEDLKFLPPGNVGNIPQTRFADARLDSCRCQASLPPVEMPDSSSFFLASRFVKDGTANDSQKKNVGEGPGKIHEHVLNKQDTLPCFSSAQEPRPGKLEQKKTAAGEDCHSRGRSCLPDIFSTVGKPLIQVRQPSFYGPTGSIPIHLVGDNPYFRQIMDGESSPTHDNKSGSNLPKKKKKKKNKRKNRVVSDGASENVEKQGGETNKKEPTDRTVLDGNVCAKIISGNHDFQEGSAKLKEKSRVDGTESGINPIYERKQRPRTSLGKWLKKRSNSVAPAPYYDLKDDTHEDHSVQFKKVAADDIRYTEQHVSSNPELEIRKERSRTSLKNDEPSSNGCSTWLALERKESVSKFVVPEADVINEQSSTLERGERFEIVNDNPRSKEHTDYQPAVSVDEKSNSYEEDTSEESALKLHAMGKEVNATNPMPKASCCQSSDSLQTSLQASDFGTGHTSRKEHSKDKAESVTKRNERRATKKKQLSTLDMKSGLPEPSAVSRKVSKSKLCQKSSEKKQSKKNKKGEEALQELQRSFNSENKYDLNSICHYESSLSGRQECVKKDSPSHKIKKRVRFKLEPEIFNEEPNSATFNSTFKTRRNWVDRKPSTFVQQFRALTSTDCFQGGASNSPPIPDIKPKWHGAGPCLPSIKREKKPDMVQDFLEKYRRKKEKEMEEDFEGFGEPEPDEVKRILERPVTATLPRYPAHWDPVPTERPPGRGGQGYCLGVVWSKPEKSFGSDSSSEGRGHATYCVNSCSFFGVSTMQT